MKKKNGGFTLVELIVVIAILGILAGVGVVAYTGYVKQANKAADKQLASEIMTALQLGIYTKDIESSDTGTVTITKENGVQCSNTKLAEAIKAAFGEMDLSDLKAKADWGESSVITIDDSVMSELNDAWEAAPNQSWGGTTGALGAVQTLTDALKNYFAANSTTSAINSYVAEMQGKGYTVDGSDSTQAANLATMMVASQLNKCDFDAAFKKSIKIDTAADEYYLSNFNLSDYSGMDNISAFATYYAGVYAFANYVKANPDKGGDLKYGEDAAFTEAIDKLADPTLFNNKASASANEIQNALTDAVDNLKAFDDEMMAYVSLYYEDAGSSALNDNLATLKASFKAINESEPTAMENLSKSNLWSSVSSAISGEGLYVVVKLDGGILTVSCPALEAGN